MALTGKKRAFADAVLAGSSNKEAAIAAGYSPATASQAGSRMVKEPAIATYIADRQAKPKTAGKKATKAPEPQDEYVDDLIGTDSDDPRVFLLSVMNNPLLDPRQRIDAAKALMPFTHVKLGEGGKKDQKQDAAKTASRGKFASAPPPKLVVNNKQ